MNIYFEIMSIYGVTFLVSMFVALIIWVLAKIVDSIPDDSYSVKGFVKNILQNIKSGKAERNELLRQFRENSAKGSKGLNSYRHERA